MKTLENETQFKELKQQQTVFLLLVIYIVKFEFGHHQAVSLLHTANV